MNKHICGIAVSAAALAISALAWSQAVSPAGTVLARPTTVSKETTVMVSPLRPDGTPDYLKGINERFGKEVTPENNGFVVYLSIVGTGDLILSPRVRATVLDMCGAKEGGMGALVWVPDKRFSITEDNPPQREEFVVAMDGTWKEQDHPEVAKYLESRAKQLDQALIMAAKAKWWNPYVGTREPEVMSMMLSGVGPMRDLAEGLCARAMLEAGRGDFDGFMRDTMAAKRIARQIGSGATLIECLIGTAIDGQASITMAGATGTGMWSAEQCTRLRKALAELSPMPAPAESITFAERYGMLDAIVHVSKRPSQGINDIEGSRLNAIDQAHVNYDKVLRLANEFYDDYLAAFRESSVDEAHNKVLPVETRVAMWKKECQDLTGRSLSQEPGENDDDYSQRVGRAIVGFLAPTFGGADEIYRRNCLFSDALNAVIAYSVCRSKTGQWAKAPEDLVPEYLGKWPTDPYSLQGKNGLKVLISDKGVRVYSVGANGEDNHAVKGGDDYGAGPR